MRPTAKTHALDDGLNYRHTHACLPISGLCQPMQAAAADDPSNADDDKEHDDPERGDTLLPRLNMRALKSRHTVS